MLSFYLTHSIFYAIIHIVKEKERVENMIAVSRKELEEYLLDWLSKLNSDSMENSVAGMTLFEVLQKVRRMTPYYVEDKY